MDDLQYDQATTIFDLLIMAVNCLLMYNITQHGIDRLLGAYGEFKNDIVIRKIEEYMRQSYVFKEKNHAKYVHSFF